MKMGRQATAVNVIIIARAQKRFTLPQSLTTSFFFAAKVHGDDSFRMSKELLDLLSYLAPTKAIMTLGILPENSYPHNFETVLAMHFL
jgi:hypothetical protein